VCGRWLRMEGAKNNLFFRTERQSEVMTFGTCFGLTSALCCATRAPPSMRQAIADESSASKALDNLRTSELQLFSCIPAARSMANRQKPHLHR
jgi:hypothetical protein